MCVIFCSLGRLLTNVAQKVKFLHNFPHAMIFGAVYAERWHKYIDKFSPMISALDPTMKGSSRKSRTLISRTPVVLDFRSCVFGN